MSQLHQAFPDNVIPKRVVNSEEGPDSRTLLLVPRFRKGIFARWVQPRLKNPYIKVKLDEVGAFVWSRIDGERTIGQITSDMENHFGEKVQPTKERLNHFLTILTQGELVEFFESNYTSEV